MFMVPLTFTVPFVTRLTPGSRVRVLPAATVRSSPVAAWVRVPVPVTSTDEVSVRFSAAWIWGMVTGIAMVRDWVVVGVVPVTPLVSGGVGAVLPPELVLSVFSHTGSAPTLRSWSSCCFWISSSALAVSSWSVRRRSWA